MKLSILVGITSLVFGILAVLAAHPPQTQPVHEADFVAAWCYGSTEVWMPSGARADCVTDEYVVEADWSSKWAEAIGQSLLYGAETGKTPAVLLLMNRKQSLKHLERLQTAITYYNLPIVVFTLEVQ